MGDRTLYMVGCTAAITSEVEDGLPQKDVALSYALAIQSEAAIADFPDWRTINAAIRAKWGDRGLLRVKNMAWRMLKILETPDAQR